MATTLRVVSVYRHGGARPGAGRKPKPEGEKRSRVVSLNLTPAECQRLRHVAGQQSLSAYLRDLLLRHLARKQKKRGPR